MSTTKKTRLLLLLSVVSCSALMLPSRQSLLTNKNQASSRTSSSSSHPHITTDDKLTSNNGGAATTTNKHSPNNHSKRTVCLLGGAVEDDAPGSSSAATAASTTARLLLLLVALLYGTLNVSLRLVYALPDPPEPSVLSAARGWLATAGFVPLLLLMTTHQPTATKRTGESPRDDAVPRRERQSTSSKSPAFWWAAAELALWNFGAQGLLALGLLSVASARAAFLTQLSVVLTPVISLLAGQSVARTVWLACVIALGGLTLLSGGIVGIASGGLAMGDFIVIAGASCWSLYLFRLSQVGVKFDEVPLQACKTLVLGILYSLWCVVSSLTTGDSLWVGWQNPLAWAFLLYSALGPGTLADILQTQGQKSVSATEANILLSLEPVFTALCAFLVLGETTSAMENVGGALILIAALIATR